MGNITISTLVLLSTLVGSQKFDYALVYDGALTPAITTKIGIIRKLFTKIDLDVVSFLSYNLNTNNPSGGFALLYDNKVAKNGNFSFGPSFRVENNLPIKPGIMLNFSFSF